MFLLMVDIFIIKKEITKKQATDLALADMLSRPEAMGYLKQQQDIFERDSQNPYLYVDEAGNMTTGDEKSSRCKISRDSKS